MIEFHVVLSKAEWFWDSSAKAYICFSDERLGEFSCGHGPMNVKWVVTNSDCHYEGFVVLCGKNCWSCMSGHTDFGKLNQVYSYIEFYKYYPLYICNPVESCTTCNTHGNCMKLI